MALTGGITDEERARQKKVRELRQRVAEKHGIAIGWVAADGTVLPGAKKIDPSFLKATKKK